MPVLFGTQTSATTGWRLGWRDKWGKAGKGDKKWGRKVGVVERGGRTPDAIQSSINHFDHEHNFDI